MARCTAPVTGHRTSSGAANCPACRTLYSGNRTNYLYPLYNDSYSSKIKPASLGNYNSSKERTQKPKCRWITSRNYNLELIIHGARRWS